MTPTANGLCIVFYFFENRKHHVLKFDTTSVQFPPYCKRTCPRLTLVPVSISVRLVRRMSVFVTRYMHCGQWTYDLFYSKVANVKKIYRYNSIVLSYQQLNFVSHYFLFTN